MRGELFLLKLTIAAIVMSFKVVQAGDALSWVPASMGACTSSRLSAFSAVLPVPAIYEPMSAGKINLFIKKYTTGDKQPKIHLIMLAGGPGQEGAVLEGHLAALTDYLSGSSVAFYLADMRGVGQSDAQVTPGDYGWINQIDGVAARSPFPLQSITLSNASRDILLLAKSIRSSAEFGSDSNLSLYGVSFGATWAYRTLQLDSEKLFSRIILDSIAALEGLVDVKNDEGLLANCNAHPYCKEQFGGDASLARKMLQEILNPSFNACSGNLAKALQDSSFPSTLDSLSRFYFLLQKWLEGNVTVHGRAHSSQLVLAFIKFTHSCHDAAQHQRLLGKLTAGDLEAVAAVRQSKKNNNGNMSGSMARASSPGKMNMLVNYTLFMSEAYNLPGGAHPPCQGTSISHQCFLFNLYGQAYRLMSKYVTPRDPRATDSFSTQAQVTVIVGEVDMNAPYRPALNYVNHIQGNVRKLVYRNHGHALVSDGECAPQIFSEALAGGSRNDTDACLKAANSVPLDWTFAQAPGYRNWWDPKIPLHYIEDPAIPQWKGGGLGIGLIIGIVAGGIAILGLGIGGYFWFRSRKTTTEAKITAKTK